MATENERSRYYGSRKVTFIDAAGREVTFLAPRVAPEADVNGSYEIRQGDRLDLLAHAAFRDSTQWWRLADANPWHDATRLEIPGTNVELPDG
ncbi:MAG: LysM domain-containing protein [Acidimicrobiales bacterium]